MTTGLIIVAVLGGFFGFILFILIIIAIINYFSKQNAAADATLKQTDELKRANDLKEKELKIREEELKANKGKRKK